MHSSTCKHLRLWLVLTSLLLALCLFFGCTEGDDGSDTTIADTTADPTEPDTSAITEPATAPSTEPDTTPAEDTTEPGTTELRGWEADTGIFNAGNVSYEKLVETEIVAAYPDDRVGQPMKPGESGVNTLFSADFNSGDATVDGNAAPRDGSAAYVADGMLYVPYSGDPNAPQGSGGWTTWGPNPAASIKTYKQVSLSADWDIHSSGDGAWLTAMWGCYVSNYTFKIPDGPGDGLWLSFNEAASKVTVYHPDVGSWPAGWADIPVSDGLLSGMHHVNIVCTPDYTTYVYITAEGSDTEHLVATVRFADGKIRAYDEENNMISESDCTTDALAGEHFSLFVHGGGGATIDNLEVLAASKGEIHETVTVTATPAEGKTLGLDITDKDGLVSICYSVWFDAILGAGSDKVTSWHNITDILAGKQEWGGSPSFHYWAKPGVGYYYRSSDKDVIRTHMTQLYTAGVDFIIIDLTNAGDGYLGSAHWTSYIQTPMDAICDTIMEMRAEGLGTPYVVFWVGDGEGPLYRELYDRYHAAEKWQDCFVYWDGKPLMLTTHKSPEDFPLKDLLTVRSMWGLGVKYDQGQWSFLSIDNYGKVTNGPDGKPEQVSVACASQETYMSAPTAHGREGGLFWFKQWYYAFEVKPKIVTLTWWNEWTAQRLEISPGQYHFTDNYNADYSRDIEPMEGGHGDQYYQWLIQYVSAYKGGLDCPMLVEDKYEGRAEKWLKSILDDKN